MSITSTDISPRRANPPNTMSPKSASWGPDLEDQATPGGGNGDGGSRVLSFHAAGSHNSRSHRNSTKSGEEHSPSRQQGSSVNEGNGGEGAARAPKNTSQAEQEWKPWKIDEPYRSKMPKDDQAMENLVKGMKESDDGMCKGWVDQIDTLIIFAGLFSATVTAFTIESYQWLAETPADTLARLQLRALLVEAHDSAKDRLAPATFTVSPSEVLINTLWFSSLTLALAAVVISILCKQWLYEYQRYDNFTTEEAFLVRGLRYRGLQAWRVPVIISSLPVLLQVALVLFLVGVLVLLWPLQPVVASIVTIIAGAIFLFLGVTTVLPAIQYIFPTSHTQCAYKSSQSWSFLSILTFWLFDLSMFTSWTVFDRWEVTCVYAGMGHTLSRAYELLSNNVDAFQSIYGFLADKSLKPTINADLTLLSDFVDGLDATRRDKIIKDVSQTMYPGETPTGLQCVIKAVLQTTYPYGTPTGFQRNRELKSHLARHYKPGRRLKPVFRKSGMFGSSFGNIDPNSETARYMHEYHFGAQKTLSQFLKGDIHLLNPAVFNRYMEHSVRCIDDVIDDEEEAQQSVSSMQLEEMFWPIYGVHQAHICWDPDIALHFLQMHSHLLKMDRVSEGTISLLCVAYSSLVESHQQHCYNPPPFTLLKDIQDWISRMPKSDLLRKVKHATHLLYFLVFHGNVFVELRGASDLEKQFLRSFAQFFVEFYEREEVIQTGYTDFYLGEYADASLAILRNHLHKNTSASL